MRRTLSLFSLAVLLLVPLASHAAQPVIKGGDSITVVCSAAITTTNPTWSIDYTDLNNGARDNTVGSTDGVTAVTLLTATTPLQVTSISVTNIDTTAKTVTLKKVQSSTGFSLTAATTLQVGDTLIYNADGIRVTDNAGQVKQSGVSTAIEPFAIPLIDWRKTDGVTVTPVSPATTNFGVVLGTDGTDFPHLETIDGKAATTAVVARLASVRLPSNYSAGAAITLRARCGMKTTVADNTNATTIDFNVYSNAGTANTGSADICATAAQSINSLTAANYDFTITPTGLVAGQDLHIKMVLTVTDAATGTAVIGTVNHVELRPVVSR